MGEDTDISEHEPEHEQKRLGVYSVRLPTSAIPITNALIALHHNLQHIAEPTASAYLKYLITQDAEKMREEIKQRRSRITG